MSRFGDGDWDGEGAPPQFWEQAVRQAIRGKRGQALLRELKAAILALPKASLIAGVVAAEGEVCALGALAKRRLAAGEVLEVYGHSLRTGVDLEATRGDLDDEFGSVELGKAMGLRHALAWAIAYENDEGGAWKETDADRYHRMLGWIARHLEGAA